MLGTPAVGSPVQLFAEILFAALANEYVFDICNQTLSPKEDAVNRPERPIPAGLLSVRAAYWRWVLWWTLSPLALAAMNAPRAGLHIFNFEAWTFFCYVWPKPGHWFWKNLYTPTALFFSLRTVNALVASHAPQAEMAIELDAAFALWLFLTIHVQDFHDIEGDCAAGRRTLPIILSPAGLFRLRQVTAVVMIAAAALFAIPGLQLCRHSHSLWIGVLAVLQLFGGIATGLYFLRARTSQQGENTYKLLHIPTALSLIAYLSLVNRIR